LDWLGGSGFTLSWGCAENVFEIADSSPESSEKLEFISGQRFEEPRSLRIKTSLEKPLFLE